jgi:hypothetical protein
MSLPKYVVIVKVVIGGGGLFEFDNTMCRSDNKVTVYDTIEEAKKHLIGYGMYSYEIRPINKKTCMAIRKYRGDGPVRYVE